MKYLVDIFNTNNTEHRYVVTNHEGLPIVIRKMNEDEVIASVIPLDGTVYTQGMFIEELKD